MRILLSVLVVLFLAFFSRESLGATVVITNGTDAELRAAVASCASVKLSFDGSIAITNEIVVACDVTIEASGHSATLSGGNSNRVFKVLPAVTLVLSNITIANGRSTNGGAIYNDGTVIAQGCKFLSNAAVGANGANGTNGANGISSFTGSLVTSGQPGQDGGPAFDPAGGAIYNTGTLDLAACSFLNDAVLAGKGGKGAMAGTEEG
jgi:hypothetical protein